MGFDGSMWAGAQARFIAHGTAGGVRAADVSNLSVWQFTAGIYGAEFHFQAATGTASAALVHYRYGSAVTLTGAVQATITSSDLNNLVTSTLFSGLAAAITTDAASQTLTGTSINPWTTVYVDAGRCFTLWTSVVNNPIVLQARIREYKFGGGAAWTRYA